MHPVEKYIEALKEVNPRKIADCFTEDGVFNDSAMVPLGHGIVHLTGREAIFEGFTAMLAGGNSVTELLYHHGNVVHYTVTTGPMVSKCVGIGTEENGLMKEYFVIPLGDTSLIKG